MSLSGRVFACLYDRMCAGAEAAGLRAHREALLADARGRVLEIGAGTGANLEFYGAAVEAITVTEPEAPMARRLERKIRDQRRPVDLIKAPAERLPVPDSQFDTVVATLVLCTVGDLPEALKELRRVLKPNGCLLFLEHVRADDPKLAAWQNRLNGINRIIGHGCNCNRATVDAIRAAGFRIASLKTHTFPKAPPFVRPLVVGAAHPTAAS
jgi:ubiquinone/menaquinone biosynthesis C-methylase UbiE